MTVKKIDLYVNSRPRSGTTWMNRLLGDALDSALLAWNREGKDEPEFFGPGRDGDYLIRKTHQMEKFGPTIFVQRDPRDIAVSRMHYRNSTNIMATIKSMRHHDEQTRFWLDGKADVLTSYEMLHKKKHVELDRIIQELIDIELSEKWLKEVFERQSINGIRERYGDRFIGSVRRGIVGEWREWFKQEHGKQITDMFGDLMIKQGYVNNLDWWMELPE